MALTKIFGWIQEMLLGCEHDSYEISSVNVDIEICDFRKKPRYFVQAKCSKCHENYDHIIMMPRQNDPRTIKACSYLVTQGRSWLFGETKTD